MSRKNLPQNGKLIPWTKKDAILAVGRGLKQLSDEQLQRIVDSKEEFLLDGLIAHTSLPDVGSNLPPSTHY